MPNLNNSYIYEDWILNLSFAGKQPNFSKFDLYHQCEHGVIHRAKGVLRHGAIAAFDRADSWTVQCSRCNKPITDKQLAQMTAVWNLLNKTTSEG